MDKMTSGEIAQKAGISPKAVRMYDEKGLLKPVDYSEGNYRLYDEQSLLILEKIIALKHVGFSLEQIRDYLKNAESDNILETLQSQIQMMEGKRYELEKAIKCMKAVIERSSGKPDWDDFEKYIDENKGALADGAKVVLHWSDVEKEATWKEIQKNAPYSMVIAHYLLNVIDDIEGFVARVSDVVKAGGMFSVNYYGMNAEQMFWQQTFGQMGLDETFVKELNTSKQKRHDDFEKLLKQYFGRVEYITIPSPMVYDSAQEVFERAIRHNQQAEKYLTQKKDLVIEYFDNVIKQNGQVRIESEGGFWHCYK